MTPDIARLAYMAREAPTEKLTSLMGMVFREEGLHDSFRRLPGNKAPGVDGVRKATSLLGHAAYEEPNWEPDGVTLLVRFYEGGPGNPARYSPVAVIAWA